MVVWALDVVEDFFVVSACEAGNSGLVSVSVCISVPDGLCSGSLVLGLLIVSRFADMVNTLILTFLYLPS